MTSQLVQLSYLLATALFIFALHWMNDPKTARRQALLFRKERFENELFNYLDDVMAGPRQDVRKAA